MIIKQYIADRFGRVFKVRATMLLCSIFALLTLAACKTQEEAQPVKPGANSREQFKTLFHDGMSEKMIGNYDRAITLFEQCLLLEPSNAAVHFALADLYEIQGNMPKAIQSANAAYELDNANKWYAIKLAQLYFKSGDYQKSATYFEIGITDDEQSLDLKYQFAEALINSRQYAKAIVILDEIEVETGKFPELSIAKHDMYMVLGQPEKAQAELDALLNENPTNSEFKLKVARYYVDTDQYEKAAELGKQLVQSDPEFGEGYFLLGDIEMRLNNVQQAMNHYLTAFAKEDVPLERKLYFIQLLTPMAFGGSFAEAQVVRNGLDKAFAVIYDVSLKSSPLHSAYGNFLLLSGNKVAALEQFRIVCELNSSDFSFWQRILLLERELCDFTNLFADALKAIDLFPSQPEFYLAAGIGAYEIQKFDVAEEYLFLGKDLVINNPALLSSFYAHLGILNGKQKNFDQAYIYFEDAKKLFADPDYFAWKVLCYIAQGNLADAESELKKGEAVQAGDPDVMCARGRLLIAQKKYSDAVVVLKSAATKDPDNLRTLELYGDALYLNGQTEDALIMWQESVKKGNQSELLKRKIADKTYYEN